MQNTQQLFNTKKTGWLLIALLMVLGCVYWQNVVLSNSQQNIETEYTNLQRIIHEKELMLEHACRIISSAKGGEQQLQDMLHDYSMNQQVYVQAYKSDSVILWNNNLFNIRDHLNEIAPGTGVHKSNNGWYMVHRIDTGETSYFSYFLIKKEFPFQNDYLKNEFNPELHLSPSSRISLIKTDEYKGIRNIQSKKLFYISISATAPELPFYVTWLSCLVTCFFLIALFRWSFVSYPKNYLATFAIETTLLIMLRVMNTGLEFPHQLYHSELFSSLTYASSTWLPSLGDVLINSLLFLLLCSRISGWIRRYTNKTKEQLYLQSPNKARTIAIFTLLLFFVFTVVVLYVCKSLIIDSNLLFDVSTIYLTGWNYFICVTTIGILIFSHIIITNVLVQLLLKTGLPFKTALIYLLLFSGALITGEIIKGNNNVLNLSLVLMYVVLIASTPFLIKQLIWYQKALGVIIVISLFAANYIFYWNSEKEKESRKVYAFKLINRNDVNAEYYFGEVEHKIAADPLIRDYFKSSIILKQQMERYINQNYFSGYIGRYDISLYDYDSLGNPYKEINSLTYREIDSIYAFNSVSTVGSYFKNIQSSPDIQGYLSRFSFGDSLHPFGVLYILLQPKIIQDENRFDELLAEGSNSIKNRNDIYSYALYRNRKLLNKSGDYAYPIRLPLLEHPNNYTYFNEADYSHLLFTDNNSFEILISKKQNKINEQVAIFSVLFVSFTTITLVIFALLTALSLLLNYTEQRFAGKKTIRKIQKLFSDIFHLSDFRLNLISTKIQVSIIIIVFPTLLFTFYFTIDSMIAKYEKAQNEKVARKIRNVVKAIENDPRIRISNLSVSDLALFTHQVAEFNNTDINLYDTKGQLLTSTTSRIYDAGILAPLMNINAFYALHVQEKSQVFLPEDIGNIKFLAAYVPVLDNKKNIVAYLNLPYFVKKSEVYNEVTSLFISIINTYVIAFITVIIIIYIISRNIAAPLNLIRNKMAVTSLGGKNEQIEWKGNDEIAQLVLQYNTMIDELAKSAEKLARSEREDAWREMAKQVAHEIKNPLTPMKLSVQHLQRAWKDKAPNLDDTFKRVTGVLIEQIDSMSLLATEFSSFAKLPASRFAVINAMEILQSVIDLYKDQGTDITVNNENNSVNILLDKDQLMRVFNNLIKNAVQSIPDDRKGLITIRSFNQNGQLVISIRDNGTGINEEEQQKIFLPNFSTKTSGMGMGLAIVKNIVESAGGDIRFETEENIGTTFFVNFPIANNA